MGIHVHQPLLRSFPVIAVYCLVADGRSDPSRVFGLWLSVV